jgi:hypothetical protein
MAKIIPALATGAWLAIVFAGIAADDEPASKRLNRWVKYYTEVAQGYDMRLKSAPDEPLMVSAEPLLVYSNPTIGFDTHGAFFVWTRNGRAEAIGAIWSKRIGADETSRKNVNHEFHSLATEPLVAHGKDGVKWAPDKPGLQFKPVPDAPLPAASRTKRLAQMRDISRQFTGYDLNPREGDGAEVERQMRVLPKPLYRYAEPEEGPRRAVIEEDVIDGAVFGLFHDWDPEILLVIETQPTAKGLRWHYGVAYVDYKPLRLEYKSTEVWSKPEKNFGSATHRYYCVIGVTTRPVELE